MVDGCYAHWLKVPLKISRIKRCNSISLFSDWWWMYDGHAHICFDIFSPALGTCRKRWVVVFHTLLTYWTLEDVTTPFSHKFICWCPEHFLWNCTQMNAPEHKLLQVYIGSGKGLGAVRQQAVVWTNAEKDSWRLMTSLFQNDNGHTHWWYRYRKVSNIRRTKSQSLNASRLIL